MIVRAATRRSGAASVLFALLLAACIQADDHAGILRKPAVLRAGTGG